MKLCQDWVIKSVWGCVPGCHYNMMSGSGPGFPLVNTQNTRILLAEAGSSLAFPTLEQGLKMFRYKFYNAPGFPL